MSPALPKSAALASYPTPPPPHFDLALEGVVRGALSCTQIYPDRDVRLST
ncbi:MAG: hypothetical protein ACK4MS_14290 [Paracoccaceae bacterium]